MCHETSFDSRRGKEVRNLAVTLQRRIANKSVKAPKIQMVGGIRIRLRRDSDIARARKALADIKPRRQKKVRS